MTFGIAVTMEVLFWWPEGLSEPPGCQSKYSLTPSSWTISKPDEPSGPFFSNQHGNPIFGFEINE